MMITSVSLKHVKVRSCFTKDSQDACASSKKGEAPGHGVRAEVSRGSVGGGSTCEAGYGLC